VAARISRAQAVAVLLLQVACSSQDAPWPPPVRQRTIAFDHIYGNVTSVTVHVAVDGGPEQIQVAACDKQTCSFRLMLGNGRHTLQLAVEQHGRRSEPTTVTLDTSKAP
jgi:hypothetical protein